MAGATSYRPHPAGGIFAFFCGAPFLAFGVWGIFAVEWESWWFFGLFAALGSGAVAYGLNVLLFEHVIVDATGITRHRWFTKEVHISWEAIECWLVTPYCVRWEQEREVWDKLYFGTTAPMRPDLSHVRAALFRVRGKHWPVLVYNYNIWRPGFDTFPQEVRTQVPGKEVLFPEKHNQASA